MNRTRRNALMRLAEKVDALAEELRGLLDEETEAMEAVPEGFQLTDRYADMEMAVEAMTDALDKLEEIANDLGDISGR